MTTNELWKLVVSNELLNDHCKAITKVISKSLTSLVSSFLAATPEQVTLPKADVERFLNHCTLEVLWRLNQGMSSWIRSDVISNPSMTYFNASLDQLDRAVRMILDLSSERWSNSDLAPLRPEGLLSDEQVRDVLNNCRPLPYKELVESIAQELYPNLWFEEPPIVGNPDVYMGLPPDEVYIKEEPAVIHSSFPHPTDEFCRPKIECDSDPFDMTRKGDGFVLNNSFPIVISKFDSVSDSDFDPIAFLQILDKPNFDE